MTTTGPDKPTLTQQQSRIAARLVYGPSRAMIAGQVWLSVAAVTSHLNAVRKKMGCPGSSPAVLVHALLTAREVPPPASIGPAPDFTEHDRTVIRAIAQHTRQQDIATAIGVPAKDVRTRIRAVVAKGHARNATHLVGLAHIWGILGDTQPPRPTEAAAPMAGRPR
ncbi:sigma-70 family RNA polymerase sigma factor [Streptomyces longwoodensis]|uniref:LuxR C-terminal-related transcriptional regulator n=1 Tax=Streptomyces longwoodensis TaxID=68231 RepID=UPI00340D9DBD